MLGNDQSQILIQSLVQDVGMLQERLSHMEMMFMQLISGLAEAGVIAVGTSEDEEEVVEEKQSNIILP